MHIDIHVAIYANAWCVSTYVYTGQHAYVHIFSKALQCNRMECGVQPKLRQQHSLD